MGSLFHIFAAGGLACATERVLLLPVDVVKTRLQAQPGLAFHQVLTSLVHENWGAGFFRGLIPALMTAPMRVVKLFGFRVASQLLENGDSSSSSSSSTPSRMERTLKLAVAGFSAAAVEIILSLPFEVLRVRLQAADANVQMLFLPLSRSLVRLFLSFFSFALIFSFVMVVYLFCQLSTWSCLKDICMKEGASSLLRGRLIFPLSFSFSILYSHHSLLLLPPPFPVLPTSFFHFPSPSPLFLLDFLFSYSSHYFSLFHRY
ncbi:hypothetical protein QOT17_013240 [Balamuthia mandrillaris]